MLQRKKGGKMNYENEIAPQNVELYKANESLANQYLNPNEVFHFGIEFLDNYIKEINKYSYADCRQIEMKAIQNFAMILNYGGFDDILAFNTLDISPSGSGKSSNHDLQKELILSPMIAELDEKEQNSKEKGGKDYKPKVYKCYHNGTSASPQFFLRCASDTATQMIVFDEFGRALKSSNAKSIIDFCIENWSKNTLTAPSEHKNYLHGRKQNIKCKIFCAMNTTLLYLGKENYLHELQGGLLNRPLTYCAKEVMEKDNVLEMEDELKAKIIKNSSRILEFARAFKDHKIIKNQINSNQITKQFKTLIKGYKASYEEIYRDYFIRLEYNYKAILIALHYLSEFDFWSKNSSCTPSAKISNEIFEKTFLFMLNYIENFEVIVNVLENKAEQKDDRLEKILAKIKEFQEKGKLPVSFSKFGAFIRPKLKADETKRLLKPFVEVNQNDNIIGLNPDGKRKIQNAHA